MDSESDSDADTEMSIALIESVSGDDNEGHESAHDLNEEELAFLSKLQHHEESAEDVSEME